MGIQVPKDTPPMERELKYLLADLCAKWGFCLPPDSIEQISKMDYYNDSAFAVDVVEAEGLDCYSSWVKQIAQRFRERFGASEIDALTFTDRVRGLKENWSTK